MSTSARVIAFEGVDGAGKSTVLELVARHLQAGGTPVCLPRLGKEHRSRPLQAIRRVTRDRTNLELCDRAEALLFAAREAQVIEQFVRPALARGETVLLDRSMLTPVVLGHSRGLALDLCQTIARAAAAGVEPDITLIFDVDPRTSRIRKRLDKIRSRPARDAGRKGLAGSGLKQRMRDSYLELAARERMPVFHAERSSPAQIAERVIALLDHGHHHSHCDEPPEDRKPWFEVDPAASFEQAVAELPPLLSLYFTRRMVEGRALRAAWLEREPALVIYGLDLADPLIEVAAATHPELVLARFAGLAEYHGLRERVADEQPDAVARSLARLTDPTADRLRTQLAERAPGAVLDSLIGRCDTFALGLRERLWKHGDIYERCASLQHCDDDDAWRRRERLVDKDPAVLLPTLVGLDPICVDAWLDHFAAFAPKQVLRALRGRSDAHAHALRHDLLDTGREVVDSLTGLDDPESWSLRERCVDRWPSTVALSLLGLERHPQTAALLERCREAAPHDLFLKRRLQQLSPTSTSSPGRD